METRIQVPVRELKNNLSAYLRKVGSGQSILITSHGRPVGQLLPPPDTETETEALARIISTPLVTPGNGTRMGTTHHRIKAKRGERLTEILLERE